MAVEALKTYENHHPTARVRNIVSDILEEKNRAMLEDHRDFLVEQLDLAVKQADDFLVFPIMAVFRIHGNIEDGNLLNKYTKGTPFKIAAVARKAIAEIMIRQQDAK